MPWAVVYVTDKAQIWCCCGCVIGQQLQLSNLTPRLGISICHGCSPKKTKKTNKQTSNSNKKNPLNKISETIKMLEENINSPLFDTVLLLFFFLGPYLWHMERVKAELQVLAYTTAQSNSRSPTHWVRPGIEAASSGILVGFVSTMTWRELSWHCS